jgi:hypothetical protein
VGFVGLKNEKPVEAEAEVLGYAGGLFVLRAVKGGELEWGLLERGLGEIEGNSKFFGGFLGVEGGGCWNWGVREGRALVVGEERPSSSVLPSMVEVAESVSVLSQQVGGRGG